MDEEQIDFVNPLFMWLAPIENKVEEASRLNRTNKHIARLSGLPTSPGTPTFERPDSASQPSSPFLKAKSAIMRTFSSGHDSENHSKRSARDDQYML